MNMASERERKRRIVTEKPPWSNAREEFMKVLFRQDQRVVNGM
jgi:hypothetical protein